MYSKIEIPRGIRNVRIKQPQRTTPNAWRMGHLVCDCCGDTWFVWDDRSGIVQAIFYAKPNSHGWSASEAHAKSYINRASPVDPFVYDTIS